MYNIISDFLSIPSSVGYNVESYIVYTACAMTLLLVIGTIRLLVDVVRSFRR